MDYNEIDVNAVCFGILCNFQQFCGEERAKEAAALVRKIYGDNKKLLDRAESAEARAETIEKMVKEYQEVIVPGYREQAEKAERERDEEKLKVDEYAESARAIALYLSAFCDKSLSYPQMISNAARKISVAYADMEKRAEKAEKERDAAVDDLKRFGQCGACKNYYREDGCGAGPYSYCDGGFEWRGEKT